MDTSDTPKFTGHLYRRSTRHYATAWCGARVHRRETAKAEPGSRRYVREPGPGCLLDGFDACPACWAALARHREKIRDESRSSRARETAERRSARKARNAASMKARRAAARVACGLPPLAPQNNRERYAKLFDRPKRPSILTGIETYGQRKLRRQREAAASKGE